MPKAAAQYAGVPKDVGFIIPALPAHVAASINKDGHLVGTAGSASAGTLAHAAAPKRPPPPPKTSFPDEHLPLLLSKITLLETSSLAVIVETVHKELSGFKVKKNAIEAKVREIGEKAREGRKVWVVKPEIKVC